MARFERSLHIAHDGDFICIVAPELGNGPLNAVVDAAGAMLLAGAALDVGTAVRFHDRSAPDAPAGNHLPIITGSAADWSPPVARCRNLESIASALARMKALADEHAEGDGLARLAFGLDVPASNMHNNALVRLAGPRLERLAQWLASDRDPPRETLGEPPVDLLGLGPGLTPSGDDLLCGVLIALHATRRQQATRALGDAIARAAPSLTTPLSRAFLAAAATGEAAESLHRAVNAILEGDLAALPRVAGEIDRIGHTSGWDATAGAALVLASSERRR